MITPELETYLRQQLGAGVAKDTIKQSLSAQGWVEQDINDAFSAIESAQPQPPVAPPPSAQSPVQTPVENSVQPVVAASHKGVWATVIILLIFLGAGGAYAAYQYDLVAVFIPTPVVSPVATTTESSIPFADTEIASTTATIKKDCGLIDVAQVFAQTSTQDAEKLTACLNNAIINCEPATAKVQGTGTSSWEILGKEDNNCIISDIVTEPVSNKNTSSDGFKYFTVCKFPIDGFIKPLESSLKKQGSTAALFMGLSFIKGIPDAQVGSDGWYPNKIIGLVSGETTNYKCK